VAVVEEEEEEATEEEWTANVEISSTILCWRSPSKINWEQGDWEHKAFFFWLLLSFLFEEEEEEEEEEAERWFNRIKSKESNTNLLPEE
jgi:hypothetical protein